MDPLETGPVGAQHPMVHQRFRPERIHLKPRSRGGACAFLRVLFRLTNDFQEKIENHAASVALGYFAYNFIKIHRAIRMSPAMGAGVTGKLWEVRNLVATWEASSRGGKERRKYRGTTG